MRGPIEIRDEVILEESESEDLEIKEDLNSSFYEVPEEGEQEQGTAFEADLDLNEMNFNLIKNSNAFKPLPSSQAAVKYREILESGSQPMGLSSKIKMRENNLGGRKSEEDTWITGLNK